MSNLSLYINSFNEKLKINKSLFNNTSVNWSHPCPKSPHSCICIYVRALISLSDTKESTRECTTYLNYFYKSAYMATWDMTDLGRALKQLHFDVTNSRLSSQLRWNRYWNKIWQNVHAHAQSRFWSVILMNNVRLNTWNTETSDNWLNVIQSINT